MTPKRKSRSVKVSTDKKKLDTVKRRLSQRSRASRKIGTDSEAKKVASKECKVSKILETDSEASLSETSESEKGKNISPMIKKMFDMAKKSPSRRSKATRKLEMDSRASGSEDSVNNNEAKKTSSKRTPVSKRIETDSEASESSENSESNKQTKKKTPMTKKKLAIVKKSSSQKSKATRKLEMDSEDSMDNDEAKKIESKKSMMSKRMETDSEGEIYTDESENEISGSETSWSKGRNVRLDDNDEIVKGKLLACKVCKKEFKLYDALVGHQKVHNTLNYKCVICRATFKHRTAYYNHMSRQHAEVDMYPCGYPKCDKSYKFHRKLKDHEKSHLKYMCRFCKRGYASKRMRKEHIEMIHF